MFEGDGGQNRERKPIDTHKPSFFTRVTKGSRWVDVKSVGKGKQLAE